MRKPLAAHPARGFTLIELLVVIAIIGILSAVVLSSLNAARSKGGDAAVKANMDTIRTQSLIYYNDHEAYGSNAGNIGVCTDPTTMFADDPNIKSAIAAIMNSSDTVYCRMTATGSQWAVYAKLASPSAGNGGWCVDSTGASKEIPTIVAPIKSCP